MLRTLRSISSKEVLPLTRLFGVPSPDSVRKILLTTRRELVSSYRPLLMVEGNFEITHFQSGLLVDPAHRSFPAVVIYRVPPFSRGLW